MYAANLQKLEHGTGIVPESVDGDVIISLEDEGPKLLSNCDDKEPQGYSKNLSF